MTTTDKANITRCTQAVLRAFDIERYPTTGSGVLEYLKEHGYTTFIVGSFHGKYSLREFYASKFHDMNNDYVIFTPGHVLCIRGGVITDTAECGPRTRVEHVWRVSK